MRTFIEQTRKIAKERQDWEQAIDWMRQLISSREIDPTCINWLPIDHQRLGHLLDLVDKSDEADRNYSLAVKLAEETYTGKTDSLSGTRLLILGFLTTASDLESRSKLDRADRVYRHVLEADADAFRILDIATVAASYAIYLAKQSRIGEARHQAARAREAVKDCNDDSRPTWVEKMLTDNGL